MWQTLKAAMELPPPPQGSVPFGKMNHEGAPPSGIEVVNAVEDLAHDEVDIEGEEPLGVIPPAIVNHNNHPNVTPSYGEELAQVKRQCDKLKEALTEEKGQRRKVQPNFIKSS